MKVVLFIYDLTGGGAERVTVNLANYLIKRKYDVTILTVVEDEVAYEIDEKIKVRSLSKKEEFRGTVFNHMMWYSRLLRFDRCEQAECYVSMLLIPTKIIMLARRFIKGKVIFSERNDPASYPLKTQRWLKRLTKNADGYVFQVPGAAKWYEDTVKNKKWEIIPNAVNQDFMNIKTENRQRKQAIVAVGRLESQKNHKLLINAFARLPKEYEDYQLKIYGQGSLEAELRTQISELGMDHKVFLMGYCRNVGEKIKNAAIYVMSSDYEGMPNSLIEAMVLGLPCIATDCPCGGSAWLIQDGINGILVPARDEKALRDAVIRILSDIGVAEKMGSEAKKIAISLNPDFIYKKWQAFIERV